MRWMLEREEGLLGADNVDKLDTIEGNIDKLHSYDVIPYIVAFAYFCYIITLK